MLQRLSDAYLVKELLNLEIILLFLLLVGFRKVFNEVSPKQKKHKRYNRYQRTAYNDASGNSVFDTLFDEGNYGEFLIYSCLEALGEEHKLLTNVYLPKADGKTTEIDLIMISAAGIYVFESKNYSGWIFGDEDNRYWKQIFRGGRHFQFYNPIWQNKKHISVLKQYLGFGDEVLVFLCCFQRAVRPEENSCPFGGSEGDVDRDVMACEIMEDIERRPEIFNLLEIEQLYVELSRYTLADNETKQAHIDAMKWRNR